VFPQYDCTAIDDPDSKCGIMLNTDFEMCYDLTLDPDTKLATCMGSDTVYASPTTDCVRADTCTFVDTFRGVSCSKKIVNKTENPSSPYPRALY
jgi:hypothetical protein